MIHQQLMTDGGRDALAADGSVVRIRPVRRSDAAALIDLHEEASAESLYRRFMSAAGSHAIAAEVARIVRHPSRDHAALVAVSAGRLVGVCSYDIGTAHV